MNKSQFLSGLVIVLMVISKGMPVYAVEPTDTVAINAKIYTVNPKQPWAEAIASAGNDIVYAGDNEGAQAFIGRKTPDRKKAGYIWEKNALFSSFQYCIKFSFDLQHGRIDS